MIITTTETSRTDTIMRTKTQDLILGASWIWKAHGSL